MSQPLAAGPTPSAPTTHCQHGVRWHLTCPACQRAAELALQVRAAHALLDRVRGGAEASRARVSRALHLVGECGECGQPQRDFGREGP